VAFFCPGVVLFPRRMRRRQFADMSGHFVAIRMPSLEMGKDFYVGKPDPGGRGVAAFGMAERYGGR
jgi:hypothetical protein